MLARHFAEQGRFQEIVLADIRQAGSALPASIRFVPCDVRHEFTPALAGLPADWIFDFAAVHRPHRHATREYFDTHLEGTRQITAYAERVGCERIFLASSTSVYGRTTKATDEAAPTYPDSPEASARLTAEKMLETWQARAATRRLVTCRVGALYGAACGGELRRMVRAIGRGGVFAGGKRVRKSYGYLSGFVESVDFMLGRQEPSLIYNYVEPHRPTPQELAQMVRHFLVSKRPSVAVPAWVIQSADLTAQAVRRGRASQDAHSRPDPRAESWIVPRILQELGFTFPYGFLQSLEHWRSIAPEDFS